MKAIELDPNGYRGTYKLVGGRLALDFVNTISWRDTARRHDWLSSPANVAAWLDAVGLDAPVDAYDKDLADVRALRATIHRAVGPLAHGATPPPSAIEQLNVCIGTIAADRVIDPDTLAWTWTAPRTALDLFRPVVEDAAAIVTDPPLDRLKHCPECDWIFEDRSRNGKRRWCDMADCGSRAKARDYYHRKRL